jgi:hypothetical protein
VPLRCLGLPSFGAKHFGFDAAFLDTQAPMILSSLVSLIEIEPRTAPSAMGRLHVFSRNAGETKWFLTQGKQSGSDRS